MPKEGSNAWYRAYLDRLYLDKANRDVYLYRSSSSKLGLSGGLVVPALETIDGVDISVHAADLTAHIYEFNTLGIVGNYFKAMPIENLLTQALTANKWYVHPFWVPRNKTIDRLAIEVTSGGGASKVARLVIYNDNGSVYPGTLLKDGGTVSVVSVAIVAATISQALTKGLYWLGIASDGTPTIAGGRAPQTPLGEQATGFTAGYLFNGYTYAAANIVAIDPFPASQSPAGGTTPLVYPRLLSLD